MGGFKFDLWVMFGLTGQMLFGSRFIVQWIASERKKSSYIPVAFWYLSLCGGLITAVYAIHIRDTVFTIAQCGGLIVYMRNLMLIHRGHRNAEPATTSIPPLDRP
jgi:lipid-A-disaccharide synthase-like uncharacterized protein